MMLYFKAGIFVLLAAIIVGGWLLYSFEREKTVELTQELALKEAAVDTVMVQGDVIAHTDTCVKYIKGTAYRTITETDSVIYVREDTVIQVLSNTGSVDIDTTITGRLNFHGRVFYPSGLSELHFGFIPQSPAKKRNWFAGIGIGYTRAEQPFVLGDINYRKVGLGLYAREKDVGGYIRVNF